MSASPDLVNKGIVAVNDAPCGETATYAVIGLTRSGTSMIGALLQVLGVPMGEKIDGAVFEDVELAKLIDASAHDRLAAAVAKRNAAHGIWGFKRPNAYREIGRIVPLLRQPRLIVLFRDLLAIAMRNHVSMQMEVLPALPRYVEEYRVLVENISKLECPMLLASYEKFVQFPEQSVLRLADFMGLALTPQQLEAGVKVIGNGPEVYLQASRLRYTGHVDRIAGGKLLGWAMVVGEPRIKAKVHLMVNGQKRASAVADVLRPDLVAANIGDGRHGFALDFDPSVDGEQPIEVVAGNAGTILTNSGKPAAAYML